MFKQLHYFKSWLLLMLCMVVGVGSASADTVTFTAGTDTSEGTSITKDGITVSFSSGVFNRTDNYRCYSGASMTISSTVGKITQIDFTATSSNPMTKFSGNPDVGAWTDASTKTQWKGDAAEINFGTTSGQARITEIVVTYTAASSSPLASISVDGAESTFHVGDEFTHAQAVVTATYEDESTADVTANATFSTPDMTTVGEKEVEVSYTEGEVTKTDTYTINVLAPATLDRIELSGSYPTEFTQGDEFSHEGLMVTAWYDDDSSEDVTADATFSGYDMNTVGEQTVTVTYEGKTETYDITVNEYVMPSVLTIDFENALSTYNEWTFDNIGTTNTAISAHGGDKYGANINANGNGVATATIQTKSKIANPGTLTCYVSKTSGNTKTSEWDIQVSSDGETWTTVETKDATTMSAGTWDEVTADLSSYTNVYVRVYYEGSTAIRTIDDISLTMAQPKVLSSITLSGDYPTTFHVGDAFSHEGMTVTANYDDDSTKDVTEDATFSAPDMTIAGEQTVTVSYSEGGEASETANYNIIVLAQATLTSITLSGEYPTEFEQGDAFSSEGIVVTANWSDQTTTNVTSEATFTGYNMSTVGEQTVTVTYGEQTATYTINVAVKKGTLENPYTVTDALAAQPANGVYVQGTISTITEVSTQYGNATYTISDGTSEMTIYRGKYLDNTAFTAVGEIEVGDIVKVYGNLQAFNNVNQMAQNNYIVSLVRPEKADLAFDQESYEVAILGALTITATSTNSDGAITYESSNQEVATIDSTTGIVTATQAGTTTITATIAATETLAGNTATVQLTVIDPDANYNVYKKVTSTEDITDGEYLIVYENGSVAFDGSLDTFDGAENTVDVTISNDEIEGNAEIDAAVFTIDTTNGFIQGTSGKYFGVTSYSNGLRTVDTGIENSLSIDNDGNAVIKITIPGDKGGDMILCFNSDSNQKRFRYYKEGSQKAIQLYKKVTGTPETVSVTITSAGAASFSSKYALDFSNVEGLKAYKATSKSDSYVHLDEVEQVPAGAGVIVKGAEGTYNVPVVTGDVAELDGNLLVGTGENTFTVTSAEYGKVFKYVKTNAGVVGFQKAKEGWTCQAGHAYLYFPETPAREFIGIFDEDISTGIEAIDNSQLTMDNDAPAYNLAGQKVGKGYKGIVVKNGKKYVK